MTLHAPDSLADVGDLVRSQPRWTIVGAHTKSALIRSDLEHQISLREYTGVVEYEPTEFTITVRAGTTVEAVAATLDEQGQYMPFDPPFVAAGATIGGMLASGLNGSGRIRHGGLRDFVLGVQLVDGRGELIRGGGKVVKNAAGFDLPKLVVGTCGWYGMIAETTLKVFPSPASQQTLVVDASSLAGAMEIMKSIAAQPFDLDAFEVDAESPGAEPHRCVLRLVGERDAVAAHAKRIAGTLNADSQIATDDWAAAYWQQVNSFRWSGGDVEDPSNTIVKFPMVQRHIASFDQAIESWSNQSGVAVARRYSMAGNVAWISFVEGSWTAALRSTLEQHVSTWLVVQGADTAQVRLHKTSQPFAMRLKQALDPDARFESVLQPSSFC